MDKNWLAKISFRLFSPFSQFHAVENIWKCLLEKCPHSYFLSWGWKKVWLKSLPADCNISFVVGFKNDSPVAAFFVGCQEVIRHRIFRARQLSLNSTLIPHIDALCIEYNAVLIDPEITLSLETLIELLPMKDWDEFYLPRIAPARCPNLLFDYNTNARYNLQIIDLGRSYYVDLDKIRRNDMNYLAVLSRNKRQQIRRSLKEYRKFGDLRFRVAETVPEALGIFEKLTRLHQKEWARRGQLGAFSSIYMNEFHRNLILQRFGEGEIQLIEMSSGDETIGCLYNFVYNGHVLFYQSGFNYPAENVFRPGLVCHYLAVLHNAANGLSCYDFLAGESQYKKSFSTDSNEMRSIVVQRRKVKYEIENTIANVYRFMRKRAMNVQDAP